MIETENPPTNRWTLIVKNKRSMYDECEVQYVIMTIHIMAVQLRCN